MLLRRLIAGFVTASLVVWSLPLPAFAAGTVTGLVRLADGTTPAEMAGVVVMDGEDYLGYTSTDGDGAFTLSIDAGPGTYTYQIYAPYGSGLKDTSPTSFTLSSDGQTVNLGTTVLAQLPKTITGTVTKSGVPVAGAMVFASSMTGSGYASAETAGNGTYSLKVEGGTWMVSVSPGYMEGAGNDWFYNGENPTITFANNQNTESQTANFAVLAATAIVAGQVTRDDGSPLLGAQYVSIAFSSDKFYQYTNLDSDGSFSLNLTEGTYDVWIGYYVYPDEFGNMPSAQIQQEAQEFGMPTVAPVAAIDGQTVTMDDIRLIRKTSRIQGQVTDSSGAPLVGRQLYAYNTEGEGYASGQTDQNGNFDLYVSAGKWMISVDTYSEGEGPQYLSVAPVEVEVAQNQTVSNVLIQVARANSTITGQVVDTATGNPLAADGWVEVLSSGGEYLGFGGFAQGGAYSLPITAGSYQLVFYDYSNSGYVQATPTMVTVAENQTVATTIAVKAPNATIQGSVVDDDGVVLTSAQGWAYASSPSGAWRQAQIVDGAYSLPVTDGTWYVGFYLENANLFPQQADDALTVEANETQTHNLVAVAGTVTISGTVTLPNGSPAAGAWVYTDTRIDNGEFETQAANFYFSAGDDTDENGNYSMTVPAGSYLVSVAYPSEAGLMNPASQAVTAADNSTQTRNFQFRQSNATLAISVLTNGQNDYDFAYVTAASVSGATIDDFDSDGNGVFDLEVLAGEAWYIKAVAERNGKYYMGRARVEATTGTTSLTIDAEELADVPEGTTVTFAANQPKEINLPNGMQISIPAGALGNSGNVTVSAFPTVFLPETTVRTLVGYDLVATDTTGRQITQFNSDLTVTIPYTDSDLENLGVTDPADLVPMFYSTTTGSYQRVRGVVVDTLSRTVSFKTDHFTEFTITGTTDTSAPGNVTNLAASAASQKVTLSWTNPSDSDFDHVNIYRSTVQGQLGTLAGSTTSKTATSFQATGLTNGTTYFFTVKAVDASGNEASGVAVSATPNTLPVTGGAYGFTALLIIAAYIAGLVLVGRWYRHVRGARA